MSQPFSFTSISLKKKSKNKSLKNEQKGAVTCRKETEIRAKLMFSYQFNEMLTIYKAIMNTSNRDILFDNVNASFVTLKLLLCTDYYDPGRAHY